MIKKYIAILRGINVSGQKLIKMTELVNHLQELNFKNISTYIQSGNISFESSSTDQNTIADSITKKIKEKYDFDVPVIVLNSDELRNVTKNNPFIVRGEDISKLYVTFLSEVPDTSLIAKFKVINYLPDEFIHYEKVLYGFVPNGYGNTKFSNTFIENKLQTKATTRNWKTVLKLTEMICDD